MGGHAAGEVASAAVIESLRACDVVTAPGELLEVLARTVAAANAEVARQVAEDPARLGMGTTLTAMLWSADQGALVHIGDSRAFRFRGGVLRRLTEDHVMGNLVSNAGELAPVLTRYLGVRVASRKFWSNIAEQRLCAFGGRVLVAAITVRTVLPVRGGGGRGGGEDVLRGAAGAAALVS